MDPRPQQLQIAGVLAHKVDGVPAYSEVAIIMPRRCGKTSGIWPELVGRCATQPGYKVVTTAQSGVKARARFMEVARVLERNNVGQYRVLKGAGHEAIEWRNGSRLWVEPPKGEAFRGDAADVVLFDEAQEYSPALTAELLGAARPLMDTRPAGQIIIAGTAGKTRAGMLWEALELGRKGVGGIVEYAAPDSADPDDPETLRSAHPGIGTLTTFDKIWERHTQLVLVEYQREYLSQWPFDASTRAIDPTIWEAAGLPDAPDEKPARVALGFDIAPSQEVASWCMAWRDDEGHAHLLFVEQRAGLNWLAKQLWEAARKHRAPIGYDKIGHNIAVADQLQRAAQHRPQLKTLSLPDIAAGCAQLLADLGDGRAHHYRQKELDAAAGVATRRQAGNSWVWGRMHGDITALNAATFALRAYDQGRPRTAPRIRSSK